MSQKIILRADFKEITGPEFCPAAITKGQKLFGHVFNVEDITCWGGGRETLCFGLRIYLLLRSLRLGDSVCRK